MTMAFLSFGDMLLSHLVVSGDSPLYRRLDDWRNVLPQARDMWFCIPTQQTD